MACSNAYPPAAATEMGGPVERAADGFAASVWGDFFVTYVPPTSQRPEEWMRERAAQLKGQVRAMFEDGEGAVVDAVALVDTIERLGMDNHFRDEIAAALERIHQEEKGFASSHLHVVATRFRLLRQHGLRVSADVFDKFRDGTGSLSTNLSSDTRGLLSLYNAAHMAAPGEAALDEAISFTRHHLKTAVEAGKLRSPLRKQVSRALDIPLPRFTRCLEAMYYIAEYEQEEPRHVTLLELARLNFNLVSSLHLRELKALSLWWRDIYDTVKLPYVRDRMVEGYFWTCGMFHEEEHSRARMLVAKTFGLLCILDDTYDVHATLEDCYRLNEAIQRWDESAVDVLPEYLHMFYIKMLSNFKEFEDILEPDEKYRMSYTKKMYKLQADYYYQEAKWARDNYNPSFKEHVQVSAVSSGLAILWIAALIGMVDTANKEAFEWAVGLPDVVNASGEIGRFLNDMAAYKLGKNKNDMASSVECYMKEYGVTGQEAVAAVAAMVESAWRTMNRACMEADRALAPAVKLLANMTKTLEIIYLRGRDAYTFPGDLKGLVTDLFLKPVPLYN